VANSEIYISVITPSDFLEWERRPDLETNINQRVAMPISSPHLPLTNPDPAFPQPTYEIRH